MFENFSNDGRLGDEGHQAEGTAAGTQERVDLEESELARPAVILAKTDRLVFLCDSCAERVQSSVAEASTCYFCGPAEAPPCRGSEEEETLPTLPSRSWRGFLSFLGFGRESRPSAGPTGTSAAARPEKPEDRSARSPGVTRKRESELVFEVAWNRGDGSEPLVLEDVALLVTDSSDFSSADYEQLAGVCSAAGRPLVVATAAGAGEALAQARVSWFDAREVPGQPAMELLRDLAVVSNGTLLSRDFGFGSRNELAEEGSERDASGILLPVESWSSVTPRELGRLRRVEFDVGRARFVGTVHKGTLARIRELAAYTASSQQEAEGISARIERLGGAPTTIEIVPPRFERSADSLTLPIGYRSAYFVTDPTELTAVLDEPDVLVLDSEVNGRAMVGLLGPYAATSKSVVILAPSFLGAAIPVLVRNKLRGIVQALALEVPDGEWRAHVASATGASAGEGPTVPGRMARVVSGRNSTLFSSKEPVAKGAASGFESDVLAQIRTEIAEAGDEEMLHFLRALCSAYATDNQREIQRLEPAATIIGEELDRRGGVSEMRRVWTLLGNARGARTLEMHWDGIGEWRG